MMQHKPRRLIVCVDDYGIHAPSDAAILDLAFEGRISAISVLVNGVDASTHAPRLRSIRQQLPSCAIGLHLNLTETFAPDQFSMPLKPLIIRTQLRSINTQLIQQAIIEQLNLFEALYQAPPDYIDGHEHVHAFPVVRQCLLKTLEQHYPTHRPALRVPAPKRWQGTKAWIIAALGGYGLAQQLRAQAALSFNQDFVGVYDFSTTISYATRIQQWLTDASDLTLLMTHPGLHPKSVYGAQARRAELAYLQSKDWLVMLKDQQISLVPFKKESLAQR
jgi:chitin disaccharide deacetylase